MISKGFNTNTFDVYCQLQVGGASLIYIDWIVTQSQMQTYRVSSVDLSSIIKSVLDINIISACLRYFVTVRIDSILYT